MSDTNPTSAIVKKIDEMVESGNLTTRVGLGLIITVFREGMVLVGKMDSRMSELENAYVRFTNTMSDAKTIEQENKKSLADIVPAMKALKWIGGIVTVVLTALAVGLATGQLQIVRP